jgi:hypothetical protein
MAESKKRPKPVAVEPEYRAINPTKSKFGKVVIILLAIGMFIGLVIAAVYGMIEVLK